MSTQHYITAIRTIAPWGALVACHILGLAWPASGAMRARLRQTAEWPWLTSGNNSVKRAT